MIFLLTLYRAMDHVTEGAAPSAPDESWLAVDLTISLWFMSTLTPDLHRLFQGADARAGSTWVRLHRFFYDNQASWYLYLSKALRATRRGNMSIATYASKLQSIADDLAAIGCPMDDTDLTLQFIDGLGDKYTLQAEILKLNLPSFSDACSRLQLAEVTINDKQLSAGSHAMVVHGDRGQSSGGGSGHIGGQGGHQRLPGVSPNYKGKNPIPGYNGYTGGAGQGTQVYNIMPPGGMASPSTFPAVPNSFDHTAMLHHAMSNQDAPQPIEWFVDSGASSHVTGKMGNLTSSHSNLGVNSQHIDTSQTYL
jgi:hypothetical protein